MALEGPILVRSDSAGDSYALAEACRETRVRFSFGHAIDERVRSTILALPERAWRPAIADAIGLAPSTCEVLVDAMRHVGWTLRRPRGAHEHIQIDNAFLRDRYLSHRAEARRRRERLSLSELARVAGLAKPDREPDPTWIGRLLRLTPMPDGAMRTHIPLGLALALGRALGLDPREVEAREIRPQPARFHAPRHGLPVIAAAEEAVAVVEPEPLAVAA